MTGAYIGTPCLFVVQEWMRAPCQTEITIDVTPNYHATTEFGRAVRPPVPQSPDIHRTPFQNETL